MNCQYITIYESPLYWQAVTGTGNDLLTSRSCCLFLVRRKRWLFASSLQYREGSRNAANENQHIAEDLKQTQTCPVGERSHHERDRKSTRLNSSHQIISYAVFCLKKKKQNVHDPQRRALLGKLRA